MLYPSVYAVICLGTCKQREGRYYIGLAVGRV